MPHYYVTKSEHGDGDHEVHRTGCSFISLEDRIYLGDFKNCDIAVNEAKKLFPHSFGCEHCTVERKKH